MHHAFARLAAFPVLLALTAGIGIAQVPTIGDFEIFPGDVQGALGVNDQQAVSVAKGDQYYLAVWEDSRTVNGWLVVYGGGPYFSEELGNMRDIYAARFDLSGNLVDTEPIVVTNASYNQARAKVAWNGENFLVTWLGERDAYFYDDVLAARVSPEGVVLDVPPITVRQDVSEVWPNVGSDGSNWLVTWHEWTGLDSGVLGARIAPDGTVIDAAPVTLIASGIYTYEPVDIAWAGDEYFLAFSGHGIVKGQRFGADLTPIDPAPFRVQVGNNYSTRMARVATDGTDFFVVWHEQTSDVYDRAMGARVTHGGAVLDSPPIVIEGAAPYVWFTPVVEWDGTYWWVAHENDAAGFDNDMVIKRVDADGVVLDPAGFLVRSTPQYQNQADIQPSPGGGMQVFWTEQYVAGGAFDVLKASVAPDGSVGPAEGVPMGRPKQKKTRFATHDGVHMAVYLSEISGESRVLAQRIAADGTLIDLEPIVVGTGGEMQLDSPGVAWNQSLYLVVWSDLNRVYGRRLAEDGSFIDPAPFLIMSENDMSDVAAIGDIFLVVGSHEYSVDFRALQAARVRGSDGAVLDPTPRWIGGNYDIDPRVATFGDRWLVVWEQQASHDQDYSTIKGTTVDLDGSSSGSFLVSGTGLGDDPDIAVNGDRALVVYSDNAVYADASIDAQFIDRSGQRVGLEFRLCDAPQYQVGPSVAWDGQQYLAAWVDYRDVAYLDQERGDIWATRISEDGTVRDVGGVQISSGPLGEEYVEIVAEGGQFLLSYSAITGYGSESNYRVGAHAVVEDLPGLLLSAPSPGRAGEPNTLRVEGAAPGETVYFVYGLQPGDRAVPGCPGETMGITDPHVAGTAVADVDGVATLQMTVPPAASGLTVWLQSIGSGSCGVSNLLSHTFP